MYRYRNNMFLVDNEAIEGCDIVEQCIFQVITAKKWYFTVLQYASAHAGCILYKLFTS